MLKSKTKQPKTLAIKKSINNKKRKNNKSNKKSAKRKYKGGFIRSGSPQHFYHSACENKQVKNE